MRELFIYYRLRSHDLPVAKAAVAAFQARLRERHPGLAARWLCRTESDDQSELQTWMETYSIDPAHQPLGISVALQAEIEAEAQSLAALIDGVRHTEVFDSCAW
jgi:hypothetical protein